MYELDKDIVNMLTSNSESSKLTKSELIIRCPYCGDSSHKSKHHLYLKLFSDNGIFPFYCFKCGTSGSAIKLIKDMNLYNYEISIKLIPKSFENKFKEINYNSYENLANRKQSEDKLSYVKKRLGITEIPEYIRRTIITNYTKTPNISTGMVELLNKYYVGFLSFHKKRIFSRYYYNDNNSDFTRYINLSFDDTTDYFMVIPNDSINPLSIGKIIVGEGVFTSLSGYLKLSKDLNFTNSVVVAGSGKSYLKAVKYAIYNFGIPDWHIYVLVDSDVNDSFIENQFREYNDIKVIKILRCDKNDFAEDYKHYSITNLNNIKGEI